MQKKRIHSTEQHIYICLKAAVSYERAKQQMTQCRYDEQPPMAEFSFRLECRQTLSYCLSFDVKLFGKLLSVQNVYFFFVLLCCKLPAYCKIYLTYALQCKCIRRRTCSQWLSDIIVLPATQFAFALSVEHTQTDTDTYTKPKMFTKPTKWKQFSTRFDIVKVYMHYERNIYIRSHASH